MSNREPSPNESSWARRPIEERLLIIGRLRNLIADQQERILKRLAPLRPHSSRGELISSELIPLLDACQFLQNNTAKILAPKKLGRSGQPAWLWGIEHTVYREALGRVLILAPSNYPLFLPMVQAIHAWAAGNSVWLKSAPGSLALHELVREFFLEAGGEESVFQLLGEDNSAYADSLEHVQKVVLVGSAQTGEVVLEQAGRALVPAVAELSGWDTVFVHPHADMKLAAQAVIFGLTLNQGKTCVAPRRILFRGAVEQFEGHLQEALGQRPNTPLLDSEIAGVKKLTEDGARCLQSQADHGPIVLTRVPSDHSLHREEAFGPMAILTVVESDEQALNIAKSCPYALGASCFGPKDWALDLATKVPAQMVSINDCIVPTADPRVPFGGSGRSGYGRMRGREGLLEMTQTRTVSLRKGGSLDHLVAPGPLDELIVEKFMTMSHSGSWRKKVQALGQMVIAIAKERRRKRLQGRAQQEEL